MIINFNNARLNTKQILERVSDQDIYEYYLKESIKDNKLYKCPFHNDKTPSLGFYKSRYSNLRYKCFGCGAQGGVFDFVKDLYNTDFKGSVKLIQQDLKLINNVNTTISNSNTINSNNTTINSNNTTSFKEIKTQILPTFKPFNKIDYDYWNQYNISLSLLLEYNIKACKLVYVVNKLGEYKLWGEYYDNNPIYCYQVEDSFKIYRPLNPTKKGKWMQNSGNWDIQGLKQLPAKGELLIITSSMKDVLVLKTMGYNAIAPHGEGINIPDKIIDYLWACFDNIIVFYDNDKAGLEYGKNLSNTIGAGNIYIPIEYRDVKDISDFVKKYNYEEAVRLVQKLL